MTRTSLPDLGGRRLGVDSVNLTMPYIFLKEENQGNEDMVKIGDCQNRKNNLSKLTGNMSSAISDPALSLMPPTHQRCKGFLKTCDNII